MPIDVVEVEGVKGKDLVGDCVCGNKVKLEESHNNCCECGRSYTKEGHGFPPEWAKKHQEGH